MNQGGQAACPEHVEGRTLPVLSKRSASKGGKFAFTAFTGTEIASPGDRFAMTIRKAALAGRLSYLFSTYLFSTYLSFPHPHLVPHPACL